MHTGNSIGQFVMTEAKDLMSSIRERTANNRGDRDHPLCEGVELHLMYSVIELRKRKDVVFLQ
jgi:hypothetical protein